ncbi:MAG: hypothetical protein IJ106_10535 [Parasporobacterium sp.]|nr:hypothetical protein [Parasporobacterium sp.]
MALSKVIYTDNQTVIHAENLNDIQDEIINKCVTVDSKTFTAAQKKQARTNIGIPTTNALADLTYTVVAEF